MSLSRRSFVQTLGVGAAGLWITSRGREGRLFAQGLQPVQGPAPSMILSSNENPLGSHKDVLAAIRSAAFAEAGRYPFATAFGGDGICWRRSTASSRRTCCSDRARRRSSAPPRTSSRSKTAGLIAAIPAYEECADYAAFMGHPVTGVKLIPPTSRWTSTPLQRRRRAPAWCSTATRTTRWPPPSSARRHRGLHGRADEESPATTVLVDEAYFEYATMPGYETMIPLAVENPRVVVARTFSKCFGMAGLRIGYAIGHKDTIAKMRTGTARRHQRAWRSRRHARGPVARRTGCKEEQKRNTAARSLHP